MGICKSRARVQATNNQTKTNAIYHEKQQPLVGHASVKGAHNDSWARMRDAPLNPKAEPFNPRQATPLQHRSPPAAEATAPLTNLKTACSGVSAREDAERMKDLFQILVKDQSASNLSSQFSAGKATNFAGKAANFRKTQSQTVQNAAAGTDAPSFVFHTDDYMRLLKEGSSTAKPGRTGTSLGGRPGPGAPTRPTDRLSNLAAIPGAPAAVSSLLSSISGNGTAIELSSAGLGKLWFNAFAPATAAPTVDRHAKPTRFPFIDDTFVERIALDTDTSEEAYWSDSGDGLSGSRAPSAHKLRRPKPSVVRSYVMQDLSEQLDEATAMMLGRVQCVSNQVRGLGEAFGVERRYILGLKEVFRSLKQDHVKILVVAPDLESAGERGGLDDRLREVLAYAYTHDVTVIFALSRQRIGWAMHKPLNISIVGIVNTKGAQDLCDKASQLARKQRDAWLSV